MIRAGKKLCSLDKEKVGHALTFSGTIPSILTRALGCQAHRTKLSPFQRFLVGNGVEIAECRSIVRNMNVCLEEGLKNDNKKNFYTL